MDSSFDEIKTILLGLNEVSDIQFNRLVEVYGEDLVNDVIRNLYKEDSTILYKVGKYVFKLYLNLEFDDIEKSAFDYYSEDIKRISNISVDEKNNLINEIFYIILMLNKLFDLVGNIVRVDDSKKKPWISDKVNYCINNCCDLELLSEIKKLYDEYVAKRNILVNSNLKLVISIAKEYYNKEYGIPFDDLVQFGNLGLIRAVETYDPTSDKLFTTYANYWIRQSILLNSKKMMYKLKIPMYFFQLNNERLSAINDLTYRLGRNPTDGELVDYMGLSLNKLDKLKTTFTETLSLDEDAGMHLDGLEVTRVELVVDDSVDIESEMYSEDLSYQINKYMNACLNDREILILRSKFGFDKEKTNDELSRELGITPQRVAQIKSKALTKLLRNPGFRNLQLYLR